MIFDFNNSMSRNWVDTVQTMSVNFFRSLWRFCKSFFHLRISHVFSKTIWSLNLTLRSFIVFASFHLQIDLVLLIIVLFFVFKFDGVFLPGDSWMVGSRFFSFIFGVLKSTITFLTGVVFPLLMFNFSYVKSNVLPLRSFLMSVSLDRSPILSF